MRINAPQLFNGEILASQKWIADQLNVLFPNGEYIPSAEVFNIGDLINSGMIIDSVYGDTIKIDNTTEQTIKEYITTVSGNLYSQITTGVKLVEGGGLKRTDNGIEVVPSDFINVTSNATDATFASVYTFTIGSKEYTINIPKDQFLKDATFIASATDADVKLDSDVQVGAAYIKFIFNVSDDGVETQDRVVYMPADDFYQIYSAGAGIKLVTTDNGSTFSIVADGKDDTTKYLVIGDDTIGLTGITTAISGAAEAVSGAAFAYTDKASSDLLGTEGDASSANTIYGTKKYADEKASAAQTAADTALTTFKNDVYTPFTEKTAAEISAISGVIGADYDVEDKGTIDTRLSDVEAAIGSGTDTGSGSLTDRMTQAEGDIDALEGRMTTAEANITNTRGRAVELLEVSVNFGGITSETMTSAIITGRVIAVFDATGAQCYPTITYNAGVSTLTAITSGGVENFTVVYSKVISSEIFN